MILDLRKSHLFTIDPDKRFAKKYKQPHGLWNLIYRRYKLVGFTTEEVCDLYHIKTGSKISRQSMDRWIWRSDVYHKAKEVFDNGACIVVSSFFEELEWSIIKELTKNLKSSVNKNTKTLP